MPYNLSTRPRPCKTYSTSRPSQLSWLLATSTVIPILLPSSSPTDAMHLLPTLEPNTFHRCISTAKPSSKHDCQKEAHIGCGLPHHRRQVWQLVAAQTLCHPYRTRGNVHRQAGSSSETLPAAPPNKTRCTCGPKMLSDPNAGILNIIKWITIINVFFWKERICMALLFPIICLEFCWACFLAWCTLCQLVCWAVCWPSGCTQNPCGSRQKQSALPGWLLWFWPCCVWLGVWSVKI